MKQILLSIITTILTINIAIGSNGVIKGVVTNKTTLQPIAFATVVVNNSTSLGAISDENGRYTIEGVKSGYQSLNVSAFGFLPTSTDNFLVTNADAIEINIKLEPLSVDVGEVVVNASPYSSVVESPISNYAIRKQELEKSPGGNRDISKIVQLSPGVASAPQNRNDLLVRGGGSNENRYYLDGIEIPILNHFAVQGGSGGSASLVNTDFLAGATFYSSAFPFAASNTLSSVVDMQLIDGNSERLKGKFTVGASDLGITFDTPISKDGRTTAIASYRRSYLQLLFTALGLPFLPVYNDYQLKIKHKIDETSSLSYLLIGSFDTNRLNTDLENPTDEQIYMLGYIPENDQNSYTTGLVYDKEFDSSRSLRLVLSRNYFKNYLFKYDDNDSSLPKTVDITTNQSDNRFRAEYNFSTPNRYRFQVGTSLDFSQYNSNSNQLLYLNGSETFQRYDSDFNKLDYGAFASVSKSYFDGHLSMSLALRIDGSSYATTTANPLEQLSPRLNAIYRFNQKLSLNAHIGRYFALPSYTTLGYENSDGELENRENGLKYISVDHYALGVSYEPNSRSKFTAEAFFKHYDHYPVSLIDSLALTTSDVEDYTVGDEPVKSVGVGRAYGYELGYRNSNIRNCVFNISYTNMRSEYQRPDENLEPSGEYLSSGWEMRHVLNLVGMYSFNLNWDLGVKWRLSSGLPYSPYDMVTSSYIEAWDAQNRPYIDYTQYNSYRFDAYHQLDIRVDKNYYFKKWSLGFYLDVQNIYNYSVADQDTVLPVVNADGSYMVDPEDDSRYVMQSIANTLGGTVLPTFGVVVTF